jgi:hypothetical protein
MITVEQETNRQSVEKYMRDTYGVELFRWCRDKVYGIDFGSFKGRDGNYSVTLGKQAFGVHKQTEWSYINFGEMGKP